MATAEQDRWIGTVLGVTASAAASANGATARIWRDVQAIWGTASERADAQVAALQDALRSSDDEDYRAVAEMGLNAVTGNHKVRLMATLREVDGDAPDPIRIASARKLVRSFAQHLASDPRVDAMDTNELRVSVNIAGTLIPALEELDGALVSLARG